MQAVTAVENSFTAHEQYLGRLQKQETKKGSFALVVLNGNTSSLGLILFSKKRL